MGIRFRCPNGHKIHVKDFLAGKRGICPKCGIKVQIPNESLAEFTSSAERVRTSPSDRPTGATAPDPGSPAEPIVERPQASTNPNRGPAHDSSAKRPNPGTATSGPAEDPLMEVPQAKWYVRPPAGGQFGPAPAQVFRSWMTEGRVAPDSFVWREGWPEWRRAEEVFENLDAAGSATGPLSAAPSIVANSAPRSASELYRRRKSNKMTVTVVGLLTLACAILFAALIYVIRFMK